MANTGKKLPIGVDDFEKLIRGGYYYLDKTDFIRQLINWHGEVNLFTRPRRFGKTLNMDISEKALNQVEVKEYAWDFQRKGYEVIAYGIFSRRKSVVLWAKNLHEPTHHSHFSNSWVKYHTHF